MSYCPNSYIIPERMRVLTPGEIPPFRSLSSAPDTWLLLEDNEAATRTLGTLKGVFMPVSLSMFSAPLFLRAGYIVGNASFPCFPAFLEPNK